MGMGCAQGGGGGHNGYAESQRGVGAQCGLLGSVMRFLGSATRFLEERDAARHVATKTVGSSLMGGMRGGQGVRTTRG